MLLLSPRPASAQLPRPWLDWKSAETEHFVFHYPSRYRTWTRALAERMEGIREQVREVVGYAPEQRVHIVVDDPLNEANGVAYTTLDAPTIVLFPTPPDPRSDIGAFQVWEELLATHEFAHVAHLARPSRNRWTRLLWSLSPVPIGPITAGAPRWVDEGYATYVEGLVSGTGRPNGAWRAAVIRQFAIDGRMPSYGELSATDGWQTGNFAYLVGSAYFEWLVRREGDSSVTALWRRMTAVTDRSFGEAFAGVYGAAPDELYGRFRAEVTTEALNVEKALKREGLVEGSLVQRLSRTTGDPAVSPDGRFVALTIRKPDLPSELVVWRTADEPDTLAERRRAEQRKRDPEDVPDRNFYPPPKKPVISLIAESGAPYESPRWLADNKHLLVTRRMPLSDGTVRSDLYLWSAEDGELRRLTHGAGVRDPDPAPDGKWAAAVRCDQGWCDLVRVDLTTGAIHVLRAGTVAKNYYRPRVSPRTSEIAVSEQAGDRWRVARVSPVTGLLRYADPNDGVTRYDATWAADGASLVVTSHSTGIPNLERIDTTHAVTRLSSVTGAAVAPDVAPDGAIWFLSFHGTGFDLRRIAAESPGVAPGLPAAIALADSFPPVLPPRLLRHPFDSTARPTHAIASPETDYGFGPSRFRYLPGATSGFGGTSTQLAIVRSDPVGRFGASLLGVLGDGALPEGLALTLTSRMWRTELSAVAWSSHAEPSRQLAAAGPAGLDLVRRGGAFVLERSSVGVSGRVGGSLALLSERQNAAGFDPFARDALVALLTTTQRQRDQELRYEETVTALGEAGSTQGGKYGRQRLFGMFGAASRGNPLATLQLAYGRVGGGLGREREQFVIGGIASPLIDPMFDARRVEMPAYPAGSIVADGFVSYRAGIPFQQLELFYSGVTTDLFVTSLRSFGAELRQQLPAIPALATPEVDGVAGIARAVDEPVKGAWRVYLTLQVRP